MYHINNRNSSQSSSKIRYSSLCRSNHTQQSSAHFTMYILEGYWQSRPNPRNTNL